MKETGINFGDLLEKELITNLQCRDQAYKPAGFGQDKATHLASNYEKSPSDPELPAEQTCKRIKKYRRHVMKHIKWEVKKKKTCPWGKI